MKRGVKILIAVVALLLVLVIAAGCALFIYYPHYRKNEHTAQIADTALERGEVKVMSCNLRCANVMDMGKKSWLYRADLIVKNIESEAPGIIGFQEATKWQYAYMCRSLPEYDSVITYRDSKRHRRVAPYFTARSCMSLLTKAHSGSPKLPRR